MNDIKMLKAFTVIDISYKPPNSWKVFYVNDNRP